MPECPFYPKEGALVTGGPPEILAEGDVITIEGVFNRPTWRKREWWASLGLGRATSGYQIWAGYRTTRRRDLFRPRHLVQMRAGRSPAG